MMMILSRRRSLVWLSVCALLLFAAGDRATTIAQTQAEPQSRAPTVAGPKPEPKPSPITGTIKGRLVSSDGQPLTNASVMAQGLTATPTAKPTRVDADGRFSFEDLPAAAYLIIGTAPGYFDQSTALGDASRWPRYLIGSNVTVTMIRGGVITGLVTNANGEPLVGVPVHATSQGAQPSLTGFFTARNVAETDDRGIYRIYGLMPGQYVVQAGGNGAFGRFSPSGFDIDVPTYYPSATRDTAVPVSVRSGDETSRIDIKYKSAEGHTISGVIVGSVEPGPLGGAITIFLSPADSTSVLTMGIAAIGDPRRAFSFNGLADGEYDLFAMYLASQTDTAVTGMKRVTVRGGDVTGIEVNLTPTATLSGTISLVPLKPEETCDKRGSQLSETIPAAQPDEPKKARQSMISMMSGGLGLLNQKGEFALRNLEGGKYRLDIKLPTESWYLSDITVPARAQPATIQTTSSPSAKPNLNTWQGVVSVRPGEKLSGVSVLVGQDAARLRGRVTPEGTVVREGTRVHLVPSELDRANNILRYSETPVNSDGSFAFTNIAPGRYLVVSRIEAPVEADASPRPIAWSQAARAKLRRDAEAAKTSVELKPCERMVDYSLKTPAGQ